MKNQIFALLLSLLLVVSLPFSVLADVASGSNAVLGDPFSDRLDAYSMAGTVTNTISAPRLQVGMEVHDSNGKYVKTIYASAEKHSDGRYYFSKTGLVQPGHSIVSFYVEVTNSLPSPAGNYSVSMDFTSDFSVESYAGFDLKTWYRYSNSIVRNVNIPSDVFRFAGGDFYVEINSVAFRSSYEDVYLLVKVPASQGIDNFGGSFAINFTPVSEAGSDTAGPTVSQEDYQSGVSDSLNNIGSGIGDINTGIGQLNQTMEYVSQSQDLIIKGIDNIILHISDQLYAFWDQLYNLIHVPTMAKLDQILQAIKDMDINVNVDLDELKSAISSAASKITGQIQSSINSQITNDDKNTDHLENGYDNSGILGDKGKLDGAITEYEKVEDQLISDAKDKIGKFEFDNPFEKYTGPLSDISYFLTGIYNGLQGLNIPVSFSLTLTIALVFIGYYRFKGGA